MIVHGQHRNGRLAEKHRRALEKKYKTEVKITARRNSKGERSKRGQFFTFRVAVKNREYMLVFEYPRHKKMAGFHADVFCIGPEKASLKTLLGVCRRHLSDAWFVDVAVEAYVESQGDKTQARETAEVRSFVKT